LSHLHVGTLHAVPLRATRSDKEKLMSTLTSICTATLLAFASISLSNAADNTQPTNEQKLQKENEASKEPAQQTTGDLTKQEQEYLSALKKCESMNAAEKQQCVDRTRKQFGHQ
jgi:hypothetical protein